MTSKIGLGIKMLAWTQRTRGVDRITDFAANQIGRVMTTKVGKAISKAVLGREYDLYEGRIRAGCYNIATSSTAADLIGPRTYFDVQRSLISRKPLMQALLFAKWGRQTTPYLDPTEDLTSTPLNLDTDNSVQPDQLRWFGGNAKRLREILMHRAANYPSPKTSFHLDLTEDLMHTFLNLDTDNIAPQHELRWFGGNAKLLGEIVHRAANYPFQLTDGEDPGKR